MIVTVQAAHLLLQIVASIPTPFWMWRTWIVRNQSLPKDRGDADFVLMLLAIGCAIQFGAIWWR